MIKLAKRGLSFNDLKASRKLQAAIWFYSRSGESIPWCTSHHRMFAIDHWPQNRLSLWGLSTFGSRYICQSYNLHVLVLLIGQGNSPCWHTSSGGYGPGQEAGSRRGPEVSRDVTRWPQDELRLAASVTALYYETQEDVTNLMEFVPDQKTLHTD